VTLKTQMETDLAAFFNTDEHADSITYAGASIDAVIDYEENPNDQPGSTTQTAILFVKQSDVTAPAYRDAVVNGSDTWRVRRVLEGDGDVWKLAIERDMRPVI